MKEGAYAVIFTSRRPAQEDGYAVTAARMTALAATMPGYLGHDSARGPDGLGITVSYWESLDAIATWRAHPAHDEVIRSADRWYDWHETVVARIERTGGGRDFLASR